MTNSIKEAISANISKLTSETEELVKQRELAIQQINAIDTRLTQIVGAITALKEILGKE